MNPIYAFFSAAYIFAIFFLADSGAASQIGRFNPYSLLHIPLYGLLAFLLLLAFCTGRGAYTRSRAAAACAVAGLVGAVDEIHQIYIPTREGSAGDFFLDILGIVLALLIFRAIYATLFRKGRESKGKG